MTTQPSFLSRLVSLLAMVFTPAVSALAETAPYPQSSVISGITFNWSTHDRRAPGSDNWPMTWADNDHQYTSWGDGGGFGGTGQRGRVSLGIARIEGSASSYTGHNLWGGYGAKNAAKFDGKSYGIISIGGVLYMWVSPGSGQTNYEEARLYRSTNYGASWSPAGWKFLQRDGIILPTFLQFGKDYQGARDNYVYSYASHLKHDASLAVQKPGEIMLMRVPRRRIMNRSAYEFFAGLDSSGKPTWTASLSQRRPVFSNPDGVGWNVSASYNPGLGRYLLTTEHTTSGKGNIGIFDAPNPWGPWTTVLYQSNFGSPHLEASTFFWNFSSKWLSADGKSFTMIFTGVDENDSWNSVQGNFTTKASPPASP
jgi:hypothetical protein